MTTALTIIQELKSSDMMAKISASLGKPISDPSVLKFITGACMTISEKPELSRCSRQSIIDSVVNAASVQLPVDNQKLAYLVPRGGVCCFQPSYMGYISKVKESDNSADFTVCAVYKGDEFSFERESGGVKYKHIPLNPFEDDPRKIVGMYCYLKTDSGSHIEIMSYAELMKVKAASPNSTGVIWNKWEIEMLKAKIVRRSCKTKFPAAVAKLNALADIADGLGTKAPPPLLAKTAPLPEIPEAELVKEEPKEESQDITEELKAKAEEAKTRLHQGEGEKSEPAKPQAPKTGHEIAKGMITYKTKVNRGGYVSYAVEGYQKEDGKDMLFSTNDPTIIETLDNKLHKEEPAGIEYATVVNGAFTNYNITGLVSVEGGEK